MRVCVCREFKCPVALGKLRSTANDKIDYCTVCKENVYLCETIEELTGHVEQKHCVSFAPNVVKYRNVPRAAPQLRGDLIIFLLFCFTKHTQKRSSLALIFL
jgi:hypothetical protein